MSLTRMDGACQALRAIPPGVPPRATPVDRAGADSARTWVMIEECLIDELTPGEVEAIAEAVWRAGSDLRAERDPESQATGSISVATPVLGRPARGTAR
jgi:hypothetical protein